MFLRSCRTLRGGTDQGLMLRWTQVSWTLQHLNFPVVLRLSGARIPDDRLLATDNGRSCALCQRSTPMICADTPISAVTRNLYPAAVQSD